jgi:hypothetical protein
MQTDRYVIRPGRSHDLALLPVIERAAAARLRTTPYADLADDDPVPPRSTSSTRMSGWWSIRMTSRSALRSCICWRTLSICMSLTCIRATQARAWGAA